MAHVAALPGARPSGGAGMRPNAHYHNNAQYPSPINIIVIIIMIIIEVILRIIIRIIITDSSAERPISDAANAAKSEQRIVHIYIAHRMRLPTPIDRYMHIHIR